MAASKVKVAAVFVDLGASEDAWSGQGGDSCDSSSGGRSGG